MPDTNRHTHLKEYLKDLKREAMFQAPPFSELELLSKFLYDMQEIALPFLIRDIEAGWNPKAKFEDDPQKEKERYRELNE